MEGFILLADGEKLHGELLCHTATATGYLAVNNAVVGFQQMLTDPCYQKTLLAFTYPEVGNVGMSADFSESNGIQPNALIVRELCRNPNHYRAEAGLLDLLSNSEVPCLTGIDTRWLAVHLREKGEMPAAVASLEADEQELAEQLEKMQRPAWSEPEKIKMPANQDAPKVAVINLGIRRSFAEQLNRCCNPILFPYNTTKQEIMKCSPDAVIVSDGPSLNYPPEETVKLIKNLAGATPLLACGLGNVALGLAMGAKMDFFKRGHHGVNYPVRRMTDGKIETTLQYHSIVLNKKSVERCEHIEISHENVNDQTVEGIRTTDGSATGYQPTLPKLGRDNINPHITDFINKQKTLSL